MTARTLRSLPWVLRVLAAATLMAGVLAMHAPGEPAAASTTSGVTTARAAEPTAAGGTMPLDGLAHGAAVVGVCVAVVAGAAAAGSRVLRAAKTLCRPLRHEVPQWRRISGALLLAPAANPLRSCVQRC